MQELRLPVSERVWNRNSRMKKYLMIANERGIDAALEELKRDWQFKAIPKSSYHYIKKRLLELKSQVVVNYPELFLKFLMFLAEDMQRDKIPKEEVAAKLGYDLDVIEDFKKWMDDTGYVKIARLVILGKKYLKMSKKATKQHNVKE